MTSEGTATRGALSCVTSVIAPSTLLKVQFRVRSGVAYVKQKEEEEGDNGKSAATLLSCTRQYKRCKQATMGPHKRRLTFMKQGIAACSKQLPGCW